MTGVSLHTTETVLKLGQKNFITMLMLKAIITLFGIKSKTGQPGF